MSRTADALREKCLLNDERHEASQAEIEALQEALRQAEANLANEQTKRNNFELRYQREKAALDNRLTELEQLNASLLTDLEGRDQSLADLADEKSAHQSAAEALKQQKQVLLISVQQLERDVEESAHRAESLRRDVATLQTQKNQVSNWQTVDGGRWRPLQTFSLFPLFRRTQLVQDKAAMEQSVEHLNAKLLSQKDKFSQALREKEESIHSITAELQAARTEHASQRDSLLNQLAASLKLSEQLRASW
jgi:hypothetical protein